MKKLLMTMLILLALSSQCIASPLPEPIQEDKICHAAVSYVICDQLKRNCGFNDFWAAVVTLAIGAAKEKLFDDHWNGGDFAADCMGVAFYQVSF